MGLRTDSVIMADNLTTVLETEIDRAVGQMANLNAVNTALRHTLALD